MQHEELPQLDLYIERDEEEEEIKYTKREGKCGRSRLDKALAEDKTQSPPALTARSERDHLQGKTRRLPSSPTRAPSSPPANPKEIRSGISQRGKKSALLTVRTSSETFPLLRLLFKCTSIDGKSTEDPRNFPGAPVLLPSYETPEDFLAFPKLQMAHTVSPDLKEFNFTLGWSRYCFTHLYIGQ